jgi:hypothetical protein
VAVEGRRAAAATGSQISQPARPRTRRPRDVRVDYAALIAREAWKMVVDYVEQEWRTHLLTDV